MREIEQIADGLIVKAKQSGGLEDVRFVKAYGADALETPVSGYLAVVAIDSMSRTNSFLGNRVYNGLNGEKFTAQIKIRIYAPDYQNGQELTSVSGILCENIKNADEEKIVSGVKFSPVGFDENINAMYRDCCVDVSFYLCREVKI